MFLGANSRAVTAMRYIVPRAYGNRAQRAFSLALWREGVVCHRRDLISVVLGGPGSIDFDLDCSNPIESVRSGKLGVDIDKELINDQGLRACISLADRAAPVIDHRCRAGYGISGSYKSVTVEAFMVEAIARANGNIEDACHERVHQVDREVVGDHGQIIVIGGRSKTLFDGCTRFGSWDGLDQAEYLVELGNLHDLHPEDEFGGLTLILS